jgi:hypothetical protein
MPNGSDILKRRHQGKQLAATVRDRLRASLGKDAPDFVPLEQSDELYRLFEQQWEHYRNPRNGEKRFFVETSELSVLDEVREQVRQCMGDEALYLFVPETHYCGAVRLSASDLFANLLKLATLDQDDVLACNLTGDKGVACEYFTDWGPDGSRPVYRFLAWC